MRNLLLILLNIVPFLLSAQEVAPKKDITKYNPKPEEIHWLKNQSVPLKSVNAGDGFSDLQPLKSFVGDSRIVALGECTHGTSEIFRMKHRLLEFLVTEMNFQIFSIEANMAETQAINEYVLNGAGEPKGLLDTMYFWTWNTQEVLDMMVWMRNYNIKNPTKKLQFIGFDMQFGKGSGDILSLFTKKYAPDLSILTDSIIRQVKRIQESKKVKVKSGEYAIFQNNLNTLKNYFVKNKKLVLEKTGVKEYEWLIHNITLLRQFKKHKEKPGTQYLTRDKSMAENIEWLLQQNPGQKIVLWAHNEHIKRQHTFMGGKVTMGGDLSKNGHKADMRVIGFSVGKGTYTAIKKADKKKILSNSNILIEPIPKSFEDYATKTGDGVFFIDIRKSSLKSKDANWLTKKIRLRSIGSVAKAGQEQFSPAKLPSLFDGLIYIEKTKASECFLVK